MKEVTCPYCGRLATYVDSEVVYGRSYGMIYLCSPCDAYVGVHKRTNTPLGRLANAELRKWKKLAHAYFDPLWQFGRLKGRRGDAYKWLAEKMKLHISETHIGLFDVAQCQQVVSIMENERKREDDTRNKRSDNRNTCQRVQVSCELHDNA